MERTVPSTASEEIELYLRTLYSLLRSTTEVQLRTLEEVHAGMNSLLHPDVRKQSPDMSAFIYSLLRLPPCMPAVHSIVLGQSDQVFMQQGYGDVTEWTPVTARARRRRCFYDGRTTLACFVASRSDIEDVIPTLVAYQLEWNKFHYLLQRLPANFDWSALNIDGESYPRLAEHLQISVEDLLRLHAIWREEFTAHLQRMKTHQTSFAVRLLSGSLTDYRRATNAWWENIEQRVPLLARCPVYFVSSNTHSLANLLSGFALLHKELLIDYLETSSDSDLQAEWRDIQTRQVPSNQENFLYYMLKKFQATPQGAWLIEAQQAHEQACGITRIPSEHNFDVEAQVIQVSRLDPAALDPRLQPLDPDRLRRSPALIVNIDYPLGQAAYNILAQVAENIHPILGVYVMGKAATLNSAVGDVMIPNVVHDEQSRNTYLFPNAFSAADVAPYLIYGSVLDNQKAVSVAGTFLQNADYMDVFYREGYTDIEMEAGPFLSAVYEMYRPQRYPANEIVNLYGIPFDIGILHYASDTPLSKGRNLGAGALSYYGLDSTYATTLAVLRRILHIETRRQS